MEGVFDIRMQRGVFELIPVADIEDDLTKDLV